MDYDDPFGRASLRSTIPAQGDRGMLKEDVGRWSATEAEELYEVARWGKGYFSVGSHGNLLVHPDRNPEVGVDLKELVDRIRLRGLELPGSDPFQRHPQEPARRDPRCVLRGRSTTTITPGGTVASIRSR